ncbi:hypothetical protein NY08_190 [Rhodococcus sp. B7740]|nr:hypothetical protein NY08_190 [Rhodococcus sp. B7740]
MAIDVVDGDADVAEGTEGAVATGVGRSVITVAIGPSPSPLAPHPPSMHAPTTATATHPILFIAGSFARGRRRCE